MSQRRRIAQHEAAHAVAAMAMGLPVAWVDANPGHAEGIDYMAAVHIPDEAIDRERDLLAICVAMACPSHLPTEPDTLIHRYAQVEASLAYEMGGRAGITFDAIYDHCTQIMDERWGEIVDLTDRLLDEGKVVFDHTPA
jgi:hypothetical protein